MYLRTHTNLDKAAVDFPPPTLLSTDHMANCQPITTAAALQAVYSRIRTIREKAVVDYALPTLSRTYSIPNQRTNQQPSSFCCGLPGSVLTHRIHRIKKTAAVAFLRFPPCQACTHSMANEQPSSFLRPCRPSTHASTRLGRRRP